LDAAARRTLQLGNRDVRDANVLRGEGCEQCLFTGYRGRTGVFEVFRVTPEARLAIMNNASEEDIRRKAIEEGMVPLREAGWRTVREGTTTVEEYARVIG
jgi:type II secretory ATPase GspE/PulE/Tfp pilus assembly ATPase PilB-like protein